MVIRIGLIGIDDGLLLADHILLVTENLIFRVRFLEAKEFENNQGLRNGHRQSE